jgi:hypothetical protein
MEGAMKRYLALLGVMVALLAVIAMVDVSAGVPGGDIGALILNSLIELLMNLKALLPSFVSPLLDFFIGLLEMLLD